MLRKYFFLIIFGCGTIYGQDTNYAKAIQKYTDMLTRDGGNPSAPVWYLQRGLTYYQSADYKSALADFTKAIDKGIELRYKWQAYYYRAASFEKLGQWADAGTVLTDILEDMSKDEMIEGKISWDMVLQKRINIRKHQGLAFAMLNDLKIYRTLNRTDARTDITIDSILRSDDAFRVLSFNGFALYPQEDNRKFAKTRMLFSHGEYDRSIDLLSGEVSRGGPVAPALRGYVFMSKMDFAKASTDFENSLRQTTDFNQRALSNFYNSFCKARTGDLASAINALKESEKIFTSERSLIPTSEILVRRGELYERNNEKGKAFTDYSSYLAINPGNAVIAERAARLKGFAGEVKTPLVTEAKSDEKAIAVAGPESSDIDKSISRYTQQLQSNPGNAILYMQRGIAYTQKTQWDQATSDLTAALKTIEPKYRSQALYYRGLSYDKSGKRKEAITDYSEIIASGAQEEIIAGSVTRGDVIAIRAGAYIRSGESIMAYFDLIRYTKFKPDDGRWKQTLDSLTARNPAFRLTEPDVYSYLGGSVPKRVEYAREAYRKGDMGASIDQLNQEIAKTVGPNSITFLARGYSLMLLGKYQNAVDDLHSALKGDLPLDNRAVANYYLGFCYEQLNNPDEAINSLTESLKIFTSDRSLVPVTVILLQRATLFEKQGFNDMAYQDYQQYLTFKPGDSRVRQKADKVKPTQVAVVGEQVRKEPEVKKEQPVQKVEEKKPSLKDMFASEKRYALVIGNAAYPKEIGQLLNPVNDATDIAKELEQSDFEVILLTNATYRQVDVAVVNFYKKLSEGPKDQTVGLFYYSGHGIQFEGENFIVPIDAQVVTPSDIPYVCNRVDKILGRMEYANTRMNIMILDACRNSPFPVASRSMESGLAQAKAARGSYIAYATAPGSTASDGSGRNGLYTQELLKSLRKPGLTIEQVFKEIRQNVYRLSDGKQNTWDNSNIIGDFYFKFDN
ncbi:MAG: caspase family protein [Bacteroidetes bacterium]|nr:caspase family protein [Bacteroidota bacterium]